MSKATEAGEELAEKLKGKLGKDSDGKGVSKLLLSKLLKAKIKKKEKADA